MDLERQKAVKCLRELRNLLIDDESFKAPIHNEAFLLRYVRGKKYDAEIAYKAVKKHYLAKKKNKKFCMCLYPEYGLVRSVLESNFAVKLKSTDPNGYAVMILQIEYWDPEIYSFEDILAASTLMTDEVLTSVDAQINGIVAIVDYGNFSLQHAKQYTLPRIMLVINLLQGGSPVRFKGYYIVNEPTIIDIVVVPAKPFLSEKTKSRLHFFGNDMTKLHEKVPPEILPEKYGGKLNFEDAIDTDMTKNLFKRNDYFTDLLEYGFGKTDSDEEDTYM